MRLVTLSVCTALILGGLTGTAYAHPAQDCANHYNGQTVADIRSTYTSNDRSLVVQQTRYDSATSWICVHAGVQGAGGGGGKFVATGLSLTPTVDSDVSFCPSSGDVLAGQVGDPSSPSTYLPYRIASVSDSSTFTVCVTLGSASVRATYPVNAGETPTVDFQPATSSAVPESKVPAIPAGAGSGACDGGYDVSFTNPHNLVFYGLYDGSRGFVQFNSNKVCYRAISPNGTRGGHVTYTTGGFDVWTPAATGSVTNCSTVVSSTSAPVPTKISTGSAPSQTWLCAETPASNVAVVARTDARAPQVNSLPGVIHVQD